MLLTKQLLILGNGFDLHCGLESSYKDFFESEILDITTDGFSSQQMKFSCTGFWESILFHHHIRNHNKQYNWCDVETIIKNTLWYICFGKHYLYSTETTMSVWDNIIHIMDYGIHQLDKSTFRNETTLIYLFDYAINFLKGLPSDIKRNHSTSIKLFLNNILFELNNFERRFCKYLKNQIINPNNEQEIQSAYIFKAINLLLKLISNYKLNDSNNLDIFNVIKDKMPLEEASKLANKYIYTETNCLSKDFACLAYTSILNFNYTNVFDMLQIKSQCKYTNVHGKLCTNKCNDCKCSNIIFGIDDTAIKSQNEIPELRLFSKTYRKMQNLTSPTDILPIIENNQLLEIKFYGHSLSSADYSYFQSIFDYYNIYDNTMVSLIFYYSKGYEQYDAIYELINTYGTTLTNKDQGKNLMHKLLLENRLKIVEIE